MRWVTIFVTLWLVSTDTSALPSIIPIGESTNVLHIKYLTEIQTIQTIQCC